MLQKKSSHMHDPSLEYLLEIGVWPITYKYENLEFGITLQSCIIKEGLGVGTKQERMRVQKHNTYFIGNLAQSHNALSTCILLFASLVYKPSTKETKKEIKESHASRNKVELKP